MKPLNLESFFYFFLLFLLFLISCRAILFVASQPINLVRVERFSRKALRIEKRYKVIALFLLCFFLFYLMLVSFFQSYFQIGL